MLILSGGSGNATITVDTSNAINTASSTAGFALPIGTTAERPSNPAAGTNAVSSQAGAGGAGVFSEINGTSVQRAGGGGGGVETASAGAGGAGGGGAGNNAGVGYDGAQNTGGGGGGGNYNSNGGQGGSGIVIIRYLGAQVATGGTITSANGYTIHTFTGIGTFTV